MLSIVGVFVRDVLKFKCNLPFPFTNKSINKNGGYNILLFLPFPKLMSVIEKRRSQQSFYLLIHGYIYIFFNFFVSFMSLLLFGEHTSGERSKECLNKIRTCMWQRNRGHETCQHLKPKVTLQISSSTLEVGNPPHTTSNFFNC